MKYVDRTATVLAILGVITSLSSLSFGFVEFFDSNIFKDISLGVLGSVIGAAIAIFVLRLNAKIKGPSVFISHHNSDKDIARRIAKELKGISNHVWLDEHEINIGDSIKDKIESGLKNSEYFIIILSDEASKSHWAELELSKAIGLGKVVFPVKTDNSEIPDAIKNIAYADLSESFEQGMDRLKRAFLAGEHNKVIQPTR